MILDRKQQFRRQITIDNDIKNAGKIDERLLARNLAFISKTAKRTSQLMDADQRNVIRRSHSVQVLQKSGKRPDTPRMPQHNMLYGSVNSYKSCGNNRYSFHGEGDQKNRRDSSHRDTPYSDNMMNDLRSIANKALEDMSKARGQGRERADSGGLSRRTSQKEKSRSAADNILQQNRSKWHGKFQRSASQAVLQREPSRSSLSAVQKFGWSRSYSCDLPRLDSGKSGRSSLLSRKSEPTRSGKYQVYLPTIDK